jgi:hypothetical protein
MSQSFSQEGHPLNITQLIIVPWATVAAHCLAEQTAAQHYTGRQVTSILYDIHNRSKVWGHLEMSLFLKAKHIDQNQIDQKYSEDIVNVVNYYCSWIEYDIPEIYLKYIWNIQWHVVTFWPKFLFYVSILFGQAVSWGGHSMFCSMFCISVFGLVWFPIRGSCLSLFLIENHT